jgi:hypothetical protein
VREVRLVLFATGLESFSERRPVPVAGSKMREASRREACYVGRVFWLRFLARQASAVRGVFGCRRLGREHQPKEAEWPPPRVLFL